MGYLIVHNKSGDFVLSGEITVSHFEFAHTFETRKQALNFMNDHKLSHDDFGVFEDKQFFDSYIRRINLVDDIFED